WSGGWRGALVRDGHSAGVDHRLTVWGPLHDTDLVGGEEYELPRVLVGAWRGDGWTAVRRHLESVRPRRALPWVVYNSYFNDSLAATEDRLLAHADVAAEIGVEVFTLDAGWYETPEGAGIVDFSTPGLGTWTVDERKFPQGLAPVSQHVRDRGMTFGLWFDPE